jgi:hypothetical protein
MISFKQYCEGEASLNHTTTKQVSYKYAPSEYADSHGNIMANTNPVESEESRKKRKKKRFKR